jgi:hypothetical protein
MSDPARKRDSKVQIKLNESELGRLDLGCQVAGLPRAQLIRTAALQVADQLIQRGA